LSAKLLEILALERKDIYQLPVIVEDDRAGVRIDSAQQNLAEGGLAAAALSYQSKALPTFDLEADGVDCDHARTRSGAAEQTAFADRVGLSHVDTFEQRGDRIGRPFPLLRHQMRSISGRYLPYRD
jgi:hypothetical protein